MLSASFFFLFIHVASHYCSILIIIIHQNTCTTAACFLALYTCWWWLHATHKLPLLYCLYSGQCCQRYRVDARCNARCYIGYEFYEFFKRRWSRWMFLSCGYNNFFLLHSGVKVKSLSPQQQQQQHQPTQNL